MIGQIFALHVNLEDKKNALASLAGAYFWFLKKQEYYGKILFILPVYLQEMLAKLKLFVIDVFISPNCKTIDKL